MDIKARNTKPAYADVTPEMIQDWKAKYGDAEGSIYDISIPLTSEEGGPEVGFFLCVPSRTVVDRVAELGHKGQVLEANKVMIANCVLGGDIDVLERDGNIYEAVLQEIQKLRKQRVSSVKKL